MSEEVKLSLHLKALQIAISQIGVQEHPKGSNSGPEVNQYLKSVGLSPGYSWCMAFCYWCYKRASEITGIETHILETGGVLAQWNARKNSNQILTPIPGCIFILDYGKGLGHTGFVERVEGEIMYTIEGNSNDDGSREGYEVVRHKRQIKSAKGFLLF